MKMSVTSRRDAILIMPIIAVALFLLIFVAKPLHIDYYTESDLFGPMSVTPAFFAVSAFLIATL
jgi:hypothetical protein